MTTAYVNPLAFLTFPDIEVTIGDIARNACPWCDVEPERPGRLAQWFTRWVLRRRAQLRAGAGVTTVRVHGDPDESLFSPIHTTDCCGQCANEVIDRALSEQSDYSRAPIRVEIAR